MSMSEPLQPHPESPDTAFDERPASVPEEHGERAEANTTRTWAGDAHAKDINDTLPLPDHVSGDDLSADHLNGEAPD